MARYQTTVLTTWPVEEAFDYMADLRNFEEWDAGVSSATLVVGAPGGDHAVYELVASGAELCYEITAFDRPHSFTAHAKNRFIESIDTVTVAGRDGGSAVTYDATVTLNGLLGLFDPLFGLVFKRIGDRAAAGLEKALEGERVR